MPKLYNTYEQEQLKEQLLDISLNIMKIKGYTHASVDEIAKAAGISKAYFYKLYLSKNRLIIEALWRQQDRLVARFRYLISHTGETKEECLRRLLEEIAADKSGTVFCVTSSEATILYDEWPADVKEKFFSHLYQKQYEIVCLLGIGHSEIDVHVFGNLLLNFFTMLGRRTGETYYNSQAFGSTVEILIEAIIGYVGKYL